MELYEQTYNKACDIFGEDHPQTFIAENNMATVYSNAGDYKKASHFYARLYHKQKEVLEKNILILCNLELTLQIHVKNI